MAAQLAPRTASHLIPKSSAIVPGSLTGVVVSVGKMQRTVKIRTTKQKFNAYLKRHYNEHPTFMVSDPADSLREGDIVRFAPWPKTKKVRHVVTDLMVPFGPPADERPAVTGLEELVRRKQEQHAREWEKKQARKRAVRAEQAGEEGVVEAQSDGKHSDFTGKKIDGLRQQGLEQEEQAERIEAEAEQDGIDLNKRLNGVKI